MNASLEDFFNLRTHLPVVDVRSEGEFMQGHIPAAINIPLLNNEERIVVGTEYKIKGQAEAIRTGFKLVGPRLHTMIDRAADIGSEFIVHCWRGGMRSANFCQFVGMAGIKTFQLQGGYKAYRNYALQFFRKPLQLILLTGCTGSGKSEILGNLKKLGEQVVNLESMAHHKGSVFGGLMMQPQPSTEQFQNILFENLFKLDLTKRIWVEDEAIAIGKIFLPIDFWRQMQTSPVIEVQVEKEIRVNRLVNEYGAADAHQFISCMEGITRKLGGQNFIIARHFYNQGNTRAAIEILLTYYDKAYLKNIERKKDRIVIRTHWDGENMDAFTKDMCQSINIEANVNRLKIC